MTTSEHSAKATGLAEQQRFFEAAKTLEDIVLIRMEQGLFFAGGGSTTSSDIVEGISMARCEARSGDLDRAYAILANAESQLHSVIHRPKRAGGPGRWWRWRNLYQPGLWIYYYFVLLTLLNAASGWFDGLASELWGVPAEAFGYGALGAVLRGLYHLHRRVAANSFRPSFVPAYYAAPWIGGLFGVFTFLLLRGGMLALEAGTSTPDLDDSFVALALVFLAGFKWKWILGHIDRIGRRPKEPEKPTNIPTGDEVKAFEVPQSLQFRIINGGALASNQTKLINAGRKSQTSSQEGQRLQTERWYTMTRRTRTPTEEVIASVKTEAEKRDVHLGSSFIRQIDALHEEASERQVPVDTAKTRLQRLSKDAVVSASASGNKQVHARDLMVAYLRDSDPF